MLTLCTYSNLQSYFGHTRLWSVPLFPLLLQSRFQTSCSWPPKHYYTTFLAKFRQHGVRALNCDIAYITHNGRIMFYLEKALQAIGFLASNSNKKPFRNIGQLVLGLPDFKVSHRNHVSHSDILMTTVKETWSPYTSHLKRMRPILKGNMEWTLMLWHLLRS